MKAKLEDHLRFWRTLTKQLNEGTPLVRALEHAGSQLRGTAFAPAVSEIAADIQGGASLSAAMAPYAGLFSRATDDLIRAGEAGGVLDVIAQRVVEGIEDGSLPLPGVPPKGDQMTRYWRLFARMLSCGVPVLHVLEALQLEVAEGELKGATERIHADVLQGRTIAAAMREFPDVFPEGICAAIEDGEESGTVDEKAREVAEALEARDLSSLPGGGEGRALEEQSPVPRFVNAMIIEALQRNASDVHLDPLEGDVPRVRLRVDGVLHELESPRDAGPASRLPHSQLANRIKIMAGMDVSEKRLPQDGRVQLNVAGRPYDLRVSTLPTIHGERVCMRVLGREPGQFDLEAIGLLEEDRDKVRDLCHVSHGLVLCAGPTGSGKTTLLYSMLREVNYPGISVLSVEDPVEYELEGVAQVGVNPQIGRTFARTVRSVLRQDPDVILIGEIRNAQVANLAAQCAMTGHLVLTVLHADSAPQGLKRMVDIGVEPFVVNASVAGVISQRLVRVLCSECKEPAETPSAATLPREAGEFIRGREGAEFHSSVGCEACNGTGYRGRTAIHEVLLVDEGVRRAVAESGELADIRQAALAAGMRTMLECGMEKAARGITTVEEVLRVIAR